MSYDNNTVYIQSFPNIIIESPACDVDILSINRQTNQFVRIDSGSSRVVGDVLKVVSMNGTTPCMAWDDLLLQELGNVEITAPIANEVLTFDGTKWVNDSAPPPAGIALDDLIDVNLTAPVANEVLTFDGTYWVNSAIPPPTNISLDDLTDVVLTVPTSDQFLIFDGTKWINSDGTTAVQNALASCSLNDLSDVTITGPVTNELLLYDGTKWINADGTFITGTTNTAYPLAGIGTISNPVQISPGSALSQEIRYDGTVWNIKDSVYNAVIGTNGDFTNIADAINANCTRIAVIEDTTITGLITLTADTYIKIYNEAKILNNALNTCFELDGFNLTIEGNGSIIWTTTVSPMSYYILNSGVGVLPTLNMRGITFSMSDVNVKYISNVNQRFSDVTIDVPLSFSALFLNVSGANSELSNVILRHNGSGYTGGIILKNDGYLNIANMHIDAVTNGTNPIMDLAGYTNMSNITINPGTNTTGTIWATSNITNISNMSINGGAINLEVNGQINLNNINKLGLVNITADKARFYNCVFDDNCTINGNKSKIVMVETTAKITINGNQTTINASTLNDVDIKWKQQYY